jgi:hypothetical protein
MSANTNGWVHPHKELWTLGPLSIVKQLCERRHVHIYELYSHTRFVQAFANLAAAMQHAKQLGWAVAS